MVNEFGMRYHECTTSHTTGKCKHFWGRVSSEEGGGTNDHTPEYPPKHTEIEDEATNSKPYDSMTAPPHQTHEPPVKSASEASHYCIAWCTTHQLYAEKQKGMPVDHNSKSASSQQQTCTRMSICPQHKTRLYKCSAMYFVYCTGLTVRRRHT